MSFYQKFIFSNIFVFAILFIDRITKYFISLKSSNWQFFLVEKKYFTFGFKFFANKNLAFSIPFPQIITLFLIIIILTYLLYYCYKQYKSKNFWQVFFLNLIIFGALSNLFDRLYYGYVIDFINVYFGFLKFAVFNISDAMIVIGVLGILFLEIKNNNKKKELKALNAG